MTIDTKMFEEVRREYSRLYLKMFQVNKEIPYDTERPFDQGRYLDMSPTNGYALVTTDGRRETRIESTALDEFMYLLFLDIAKGRAFLSKDSPKNHVDGLILVRELMGRVSSQWAMRAAESQREMLMKRDGYVAEDNFG